MNKLIVSSLALLSLCAFSAGCKKKVVAVVPPTPKPVEQAANVTPPARPPAAEPPARTPAATPAPPSRMPDAATRARIQELLDRIQDAHFDYDKHTLRPDAEAALRSDAQTLAEIIRQYPDFKLTVE